MRITQFNGGQSSRLAPHLINQNQGVVYKNVDNSLGILAPEKGSVSSGIAVEQFAKYFAAEETWLSSATKRDYLEFQGSMLIADRVNQPQRYEDGEYHLLGIVPPDSTPELAATNEVSKITSVTVVNKTNAGDLPGGDLHYFVVNSNNNYYSLPYQITVDSSGSTSTTASGFYDTEWTLGIPLPTSSVTTIENPDKRSVKFSDLKGRDGDTAYVYRYYEGTWYLVGELDSETAEFTDTVEDISANDELDADLITAFSGTYQYVYTYYNSTKGVESGPSPVSEELELDGGYITISNIELSSDSQVDTIRIYRVGNNLTQFTLVEEITPATSYADKLRDTSVDGFLLESDNYMEAPEGLKYLTESYAMVFGAVGSTLRFTPIGNATAWPEEYSLEFYSIITGLGAVASGILVMTEDKTHIVTGTGPTSLAQQSLRGDQGCIAQESVQQVVGGSLIWASKDGLCTSSGNNVLSLTKSLLGKISLDPVDSIVYDEVYYVLNSDGSILAWDYRFDTPIAKYLDLGIEAFAKGTGTLYGWKDGELVELFAGANLEYNFVSPVYTEGSFTAAKTYKKVYIRSDGDIILKIIIDNNLVATRQLSSEDTHMLQVPQQLQRGYSIQFDIQGTGTVYEIMYDIGAQNG